MNIQHYHHHNDTLPRIPSNHKITTRIILTSNSNQQENIHPAPIRQRSVSALHSSRKPLQSSNSSKAVRLQVTTAAYHKKIDQLERQEAILTKDIEAVNADIIKIRLKKKGAQESLSTISSRTSSAAPEGGRAKLQALRRRLDKETERARKIMSEVEKVRKDIQTTKKLNTQITEQLQNCDENLAAELALASELEQTLAFKSAEGQQKKIEMVHQRAKIIKEYDAILNKLQNQLSVQDTTKPPPTDFYLTNIASADQRPRKRSQVLVENSPKGLKAANRVEYFREKLEEWRAQTQTIKEKVQATTLEEAEQKLVGIHQNNYHYYKFTNERHAALKEVQYRNSQLKAQKLALSQEIAKKENSASNETLSVTKQNIRKACESQYEVKVKIVECEQVYEKTKAFLCQLIRQSGLMLPVLQEGLAIEQQVTKTTLSGLLQSLLQAKNCGISSIGYFRSQ